MALQIIQDAPNKYHFKTKDNQQVNIEHKDRCIVFDLFKWGEEVSLQVKLNIVLADTHQFQDNKIEIDTAGFALRVYPIDTRSTGDLYGDTEDQIQCHDGGSRFELVLKGKPIRNYFTVSITAKNLRFAYQPFLTQEDIDAGVRCPLNVEGSYAVYHVSKKDNQFKTGKAFHLYRPIAEDALGAKAWCSIEIDGYINPTSLTITIPQQFIDDVTYPITIDPDFGYSAIGGLVQYLAADVAPWSGRMGSAWTMPAGGGTVNYMRAYLSSADVTCDCKAIINQRDSGGVNTHDEIAGPVENLACAMAAHWEEFTFSGEVLTAAVVYILNLAGNGVGMAKGDDYRIYYDVNGGVDSYFSSGINYAALTDPWVKDPQVTTWDFSIYCNYTVAAGWTGKISGVTNPAEIAGVAVANIAEVKGVA